MKEKLLTKSGELWVNEYYQIDDYVLLKIFRKDNTESYDVLIDTEDFELVSQGQWYGCMGRKNSHLKNIILILYTTKSNNKRTCYQLHQWILGTKRKGVIIDHINMNRLDNRKSNLRETTAKVNRLNQEYKCYINRGIGFTSMIRVEDTSIETPVYNTKEEAIVSYLKACIILEREKVSTFIKDKVQEYNVIVSEDDYKDVFLSKVISVLNGEYLKSTRNYYKCENHERRLNRSSNGNINRNRSMDVRYNYDKQTGKFMVRIKVNGKDVNIGRYVTEYESETMYLKACIVMGYDKNSELLANRIKELNISLTEEDYKNKYIQKIIMLKDNINSELPKEMNGRYNLKYDENIELIYDLYNQGYSWHGIAMYLKKNTDFKTAKGEIIKQRLNEYIEKLNNQKIS